MANYPVVTLLRSESSPGPASVATAAAAAADCMMYNFTAHGINGCISRQNYLKYLFSDFVVDYGPVVDYR
jgi:hypothetical protein